MNDAAAGTETRRRHSRGFPRAENVGSLLRPTRLREAVAQHLTATEEQQRPSTPTRLRELEDELIKDAISRQIAAGLDVVTDGEFRRSLFINSFHSAVTGLEPGRPFTFHNSVGNEIETPPQATIARHLAKVDSPAMREAAFMKDTTSHPFKITFPAPSWFASPFLMEPTASVPGYDSQQEALDHVVSILRQLVREAIDSGARYIQFDYPTYVYLIEEHTVTQLRTMGVDPSNLLDTCIYLDKAVLEGLPSDVHYAMHICRGNYKSHWMFAGSLEPVAEEIFNQLPYDTFLIEWEDTSRDGDYSPLRYVPKGTVVAMGVVSSKDPRLEARDDVLRRMESATRHVDVDRLAVATQCGFASAVDGNELDESTQWRKLELVGAVADALWPHG